jgi:solute carrier family 29 (equilibrative nucleoside transporter), member 1/2/3
MFYPAIVQGLSGFTSGWLMTASMMGPAGYSTEEDREDAGAFMALYLIGGLTAGSLLSFAVA